MLQKDSEFLAQCGKGVEIIGEHTLQLMMKNLSIQNHGGYF